MRDHGAGAIIPANIFMMGACVLVSFLLPWWVTALVVLGMLAIRNFAIDQYGGMQVCMLLLPSLLMGLLMLGRRLQEADEEGESVGFFQTVSHILLPIIVLPVLVLLAMSAVLGLALAWEWISGRIGGRRGQ